MTNNDDNNKQQTIQEQQPQQQSEDNNNNNNNKPITIKDALFSAIDSTIIVKGQIVSSGKIHSMLFGSNQLTEIRAIQVELMDVESYDDINSLKVVLTNDLAKDIRVGENCIIEGRLKLEQKKKDIAHLILYADRLDYTTKQQEAQDDTLTHKQIERVHKLVKLATEQYDDDNTIIDRLVYLYDKRVIKNENIKEALLYALASTTSMLPDGTDINDRRRRLNLGLIGFPGGGKTYTAKSIMKYNPRIRFESAQSSSTKSLTAMISKEGEGGRILRIGSVPKSRQAICVIDEIAEIGIQEQSLLQNVMEEGFFTMNKHGFNVNIRSDTGIVYTANPRNATNPTVKLRYEDLRIRKQILDRTDLLIVQKPLVEPEDRQEFNRLKLELESASEARKKIISNYDDYLRLHLQVMRRKYSNMKENIKLTKEAQELITKADIAIQSKKAEGAGSFRTLDSLIRITEAVARLKLKDIADLSDAIRAVSFYNQISTVNMIEGKAELDTDIIKDPAIVARDTMIEILKEHPGQSFTIIELAEKAIERNETAKAYIQEVKDLQSNRRLRRVFDLLSQQDDDDDNNNGVTKTNNTRPTKFIFKV